MSIFVRSQKWSLVYCTRETFSSFEFTRLRENYGGGKNSRIFVHFNQHDRSFYGKCLQLKIWLLLFVVTSVRRVFLAEQLARSTAGGNSIHVGVNWMFALLVLDLKQTCYEFSFVLDQNIIFHENALKISWVGTWRRSDRKEWRI